ncbi:HAMP domain-containing histidine kinase [Sulfurimonas sp. MAG313]|nr:HAMP domain-containing sensor histidine kinase [Sulfurimonas sp. MAG313]MDF1880167.1 HAMP domain-containing histidine kinase [Sulfurimonas sp. MAG313]
MKKEDKLLLQEVKLAIAGEKECSKELLEHILNSYEKNEMRHDKIMAQSDKQLQGFTQDLDQEIESQAKMLAQQSKMAAMGEMIDAIAHQWKQPLNAISMLSEIAEMDFEEGLLDVQYMKEYKEQVFSQIEHLISTLDEFRTFFRPNKNIVFFDAKKAIDSVLLLTKDEFIKYTIEFEVEEQDTLELEGIENEFKHIILNIINNAKDAFNENETTERKIVISLFKKEGKKYITISDNAGGIPSHVIDDIFKPNVTTKEEGKGTGIGLYMSDQIAQKMGGYLGVENVNQGAIFTLEI